MFMKRFALAVLLLPISLVRAQTPAERGVKLAWENHCQEAMPLLEQAMTDAALTEATRRPVAYAGVMCAMTLNQEMDAVSFLAWLRRHFPNDADVLFLAANVYLELSDRNQAELVKTAPDSIQVVQLNAKNFERQGNLEKAIAEYRVVAQREPDRPGIHYRIGGLILASPETPESNESARKEFEAELKVSPKAAGAEYYVGELERQADKLEEAIPHFRNAIALRDDFAEAHYGLGRSLFDSGKTEEAVAPLERAVQLNPGHPTYRFTLASAYQRLGRKADAEREFAVQKTLAVSMNESKKALQRNLDGATVSGPEQK
jgi:tetratricopeptide (TPR) repeat protein